MPLGSAKHKLDNVPADRHVVVKERFRSSSVHPAKAIIHV